MKSLSSSKLQEAQVTFTRYAGKLRLAQQIVIIWTLLMSTAVAILSFTMDSRSEDLLWDIMRVLSVHIAVCLALLSIARVEKIASDCDKMTILMRMHTSGIITDENHLTKMEEAIQQTLSTTRVLCFPIPSVLSEDTSDQAVVSNSERLPRVVRFTELATML